MHAHQLLFTRPAGPGPKPSVAVTLHIQLRGLQYGFVQEALASAISIECDWLINEYGMTDFTDEAFELAKGICTGFVTPFADVFKYLDYDECARLGAALWASQRRGTRGAFARQTNTSLTPAFLAQLDTAASKLDEYEVQAEGNNCWFAWSRAA